MNSASKPNLAELSKLVSDLKKTRISPAIKVQRILALTRNDADREKAIKSFQNLQINPDEAVFAGSTIGLLTAHRVRENLIAQIQSNRVDIVLIDAETLPAEAQAELEKYIIKAPRKPNLIIVSEFPLGTEEEAELRRSVYQRRSRAVS